MKQLLYRLKRKILTRTQLTREKRDEVIEKWTGQIPAHQVQADDIFIVGYPKSGNTWCQNLIAGIIFGAQSEFVNDRLIQDLVPDLQHKKYYKRFIDPMFFKSHHLPRPEFKRVIYLVRDGRDAMVSFYHHNVAIHGRIDFYKMAIEGQGISNKWVDHVQAWLENPYQAEMIIVQYEKLKTEPIAELQKICQFVGINRSESQLEEVIEACSFSTMQQKEETWGWDDPAWPKQHNFVRKGEIGNYSEEMPKEVLEAFLVEAGQTLKQLGYA